MRARSGVPPVIALPETAHETARAIARGEASALEVTQAALDRIEARDGELNCFTSITVERALSDADRVDAARRNGESLGPLAGVPFAVKNLYDVAGLTTLAGARLFAEQAPAHQDAPTVAALAKAGAVLIGATNMDAYAYGFTTENSHYGATRNPRDPSRTAGGSSGGAAAAVAAGMATFSLGSDTNGSIRVPASFCGVFGLKPTYGRLPRDGTRAFVDSLDHLGVFARTSEDLALVYDAMQAARGSDRAWAHHTPAPVSSSLNAEVGNLRCAVLGGHFERWADDDAKCAVQKVAAALGAHDIAELRHADLARSSAFVITAVEGGERYLNQLRETPDLFEPLSRERLVAGNMLPASWYVKAQRFRIWFRDQAAQLFARWDILIAPATPCVAQPIGTESVELGGLTLPWRPSIGLMTQPISFIGLPVATVPLKTRSGLPLGVQLIGAPWREKYILRLSAHLEQLAIASCTRSP